MTHFADHLRTTDFSLTVSDGRKLKLDPDTMLPTHLGPFEILGGGPKGWCVDHWDPKWKDGGRLEGYRPTFWDAFDLMLSEYRRWHEAQPRPVVYFIGTELRVGREIKIGFTRNIKARLSTIQTGHPEKLQVFATVPGGPDKEEYYHKRWRTRRRQGEWFTLGDCIIHEIERLQKEASSMIEAPARSNSYAIGGKPAGGVTA